jgi:cellulose synthase/poly-beta-1,6-N-acetylglucosamine synthase-like glycosyltransferase
MSNVEVLIGSDNSSDSTDEILTRLAGKYTWMRPNFFEKRTGKAGIINKLVPLCRNEIIVFTDANTLFDKDGLRNLILPFTDTKVGGVSGRLILLDPEMSNNEGVEESKYWRYETIIKKLEGNCGILIGANGGMFAIRKELFVPIPIERPVTDDLFVSLSVLEEGYKFIYQSNASGVEYVGKNIQAEYSRKVRFSATNFQTLSYLKKLLFNKRILVSFALWSHKVTRWFLPFILTFLFIGNLILYGSGIFYSILFHGQILFYLFAAIGFGLSKLLIRFSLFSIPYFFVVTNIAIFVGFIKFLRNKHSVVWESTER